LERHVLAQRIIGACAGTVENITIIPHGIGMR
jgi:hypothetical protein